MPPSSIQASVALRGASPGAFDFDGLVRAMGVWRPNRTRQSRSKRPTSVLMLEGAEAKHQARDYEVVAHRTAAGQPVSLTHLTTGFSIHWPTDSQQTMHPYEVLLAKMERHTPKKQQAGVYFTLKIDTQSVVFDVVEHARPESKRQAGPSKPGRPPLKRLQHRLGPRPVANDDKAMPISGNTMTFPIRKRSK